MKLDFVCGSKEEFREFLNKITPEDNCIIFTHVDLDGISSAFFLEKILENQNKNLVEIKFLDYNLNLRDELAIELKQKKISKVFICDLGLDSSHLEDFEYLRREFDVFLIDHHPLNNSVEKKNILKTHLFDCASMIVYFLAKDFFDVEEWDWLLCATMFSEFSYNKTENFEFMQKRYPLITLDNLSLSVPGIIGRKIFNALVYYKSDIKKVYEIVKNKNLEELDDINQIIEDEINFHVEKFSNEAILNKEKSIYFYELDSKFQIASVVATLISKIKPESLILILEKEKNNYKISGRNQGGNFNVGEIMIKAVSNLEGAKGGGHPPAGAARFNFEDLEKFKQNIGF